MDTSNEKTSTRTTKVNMSYADSLESADNADFKSSKKLAKKKFDITDHGGLLFLVIIAIVFLAIGFERYIVRGNFFRIVTETIREDEPKQEGSAGLDLTKTLEQAQDSIKEEIEEIRKERGLPEQVFQRNIPPDENVGALLTKDFSLFPQKYYDQLRDCISPTEPWFVDEERLQKQAGILAEYSPQRDRLRDLLDNPDAQFEQELTRTNIGLVPDEQSIVSAWSYLTLEECETARCLQEEDMDGAVEALRYMLRFAEVAGQTQFAEMRIHVVYMRENALRILQVLAVDPNFTPKHASTIFRVLHETLKDWPSDAKAWIGDRADTLKRFELIRQNRIREALEDEDLEKLRLFDVLGFEIPRERRQTRGTISLLDQVALYKPKSCDKDQDYYLKAMRILIDSCSQPFYLRLRTLDQAADNLQSQQGKKDFPALSMLFLSGIREQMQKQAMDRVRVDAWYLALASSLKLPVREGSVDPVRGKPYVITRQGGRIIVSYGENDGQAETKE